MDAAERNREYLRRFRATHPTYNRDWMRQFRRSRLARFLCEGPGCLTKIPGDRGLCHFCRKSLRLGFIAV